VSGASIDDERSFLLDSLEDLERERAAGDITDEDYARLRDRYTRRAAAVLRDAGSRSADDDEDAPSPGSPSVGRNGRATAQAGPDGRRVERGTRRRRRGLLVGAGCAIVAALAVWIVVATTTSRLPGQTATGTVRLSAGEQQRDNLTQAESLEASGDASGALTLYQKVLAANPNQVEALSESGWLEFEAGVQAKNSAVLGQAQAQEERAVSLDPGAFASREYLGSMLLAENDATGAVTQFRAFLADNPPTDQRNAARPFIIKAFEAAHLPVPSI
jgi:tetratricopeptide (TPR) repeat protein